MFLKGTYSDEKNLKFRIGEIDSTVGIEDNNSRIDYEDQAPEYKVLVLVHCFNFFLDSFILFLFFLVSLKMKFTYKIKFFCKIECLLLFKK